MTTLPIKKARVLYPGMVTLESPVWPDDVARREDEARWAEQAAPEADLDIGASYGSNVIEGGAGSDRLLPDHDPNAPWNVGVAHDSAVSARLPYDLASLDRAEPRIEPDIDAMQRDRESKNITYSRLWPVPGGGRPTKLETKAPNGKKYFNGHFAPDGSYRKDKHGNPKPHYGVDLPAASGTAIMAADDGIVVAPVLDLKDKNFGKNVVVAYDGGKEQGLYGHMGPAETPPIGSRVKRGQKIGEVGTSGNAKNGGDHLHYEVRKAKLNRKTKVSETWNKRSKGGGVPVYPGHGVSRRNAIDD